MSNPGDTYRQTDPDIITSLIESLPLHVFAKDRQGRFIHANRCYCDKIGVPLAELIGLDDFDIHPPELAEKYRLDDSRIMTVGRTEMLEEAWQAQDGMSTSWVQTIKAPLRSHDTGEVIGTIGIFWDITEKKQGEIALAEERNLLRTLIDNLPDCIYVKDAESRFLVANIAVARLMGADAPEKLLGKRDEDFYPSDQARGFRDDERQVMVTGIPVIDKEEQVASSNAQQRWIQTTKVPLRNIRGDISGIIGIGHDVTKQREAEQERRRLEHQLHHAQKMETIGTLTSGIAHDFNNLLSVINGYAELLQLTASPGSPQHENLGRVLTAGRSAAKLVGQLLAFSRKQAAQARVISFNAELEALLPGLRRTAGEQVTIELALARDLWPVRMDPAQLEQVVTNLTANACDAMPQGGKLVLTTENVTVGEAGSVRHPNLGPGNWVMLSVRDTGQGILPEAREHLFEPFFSTKPKDKGTGLGLATVFGIIKQNKGHVHGANCQDGGGAEFTLFLHKSEEPLNAALVGDDGSAAIDCRGTETILVVEDDPEIRTLVQTILADHGYIVLIASNGAEAILALEGNKDIRLILTDVIMPGINGKMLADEVVRRKLEIKLLFMSGYAGDAISKFGILDEGVQLIQKPFNAQDLVKKVRMILDGE